MARAEFAVLAGLLFFSALPAATAAAKAPPSASSPAPSVDSVIASVKPPGKYSDGDRADLKFSVDELLANELKSQEQINQYLQDHPAGDIHDALQQILIEGVLGAAKKTADGPINPPNSASSPPSAAGGPNRTGLPPGFAFGEDLARRQQQSRPQDAGANRRLGLYEYLGRDYRGAFDRFDQAYQSGDRSPELLTRYADAAYQLGDYRTAASAALLALQADPGNRDAMAVYQFSKGRVPAVSLPTSLGEQWADPSPGESPDGGGVAASPSAAGAAPAPSGTASGSDAPARSQELAKGAADAMRVRDYPAAYRLASRAVELNPQNAQALNFRAMSLSQMRRYSDAVRDASAALALAPGSAAALHTRSWAFNKEGKYKEGLQDARSAALAEPSNAYLYQDEAFALAGLGDRGGALDALRRSAALDPRFAARLERAVQLPQDADMTLLFDDGASPPAAASKPSSRPRRFLRLAALTLSGGLLVALGILHVASASWREKVRVTVRRVLGPSEAPAAAPAAGGPSADAFWTQYVLVKKIGLGGMGVVYEGVDRSLERRVAIKKMRDEIRLDPLERARFIAEARMVAQLHHPNIVDVYAIVEDGPDVYLVFEFVEGRTLEDALKSGGPMEFSAARRVIREMAAAVAHAHERGIIHRDLKLSNAMLTAQGGVKVMDFGVARQAKDAMTRHSMPNSVVGTPSYMAPEQERGNVRREADVYGLGVCLYEMVTGRLPFSGSGAAMLMNKLEGRLIPASARVPGLPAGLDAVIARALAPDPDQRTRTPGEFAAALDALSAG